MAKMFYSLEEAAQRLGKSADEVRGMVSKGELQEFRDRDQLKFKREQVDLIAGDGPSGQSSGGSGFIPLADSKGGSGFNLALDDSSARGAGAGGAGAGGAGKGKSGQSGSGMSLELDDEPMGGGRGGAGGNKPSSKAVDPNRDPKQRSGISIFDTDTDESDPLAATRISDVTKAGPDLQMDSVGSGSGLLDLTREADDTSLGADLLEDVYNKDEAGETGGASGLFESTTAPSDMSAAAALAGGAGGMGMVAAEPYDGAWSGVGAGAAIGLVAVVGVALFAALTGIMDAGENGIVRLIAGNVLMWAGIFAGVVAIGAAIGFVLGRKK